MLCSKFVPVVSRTRRKNAIKLYAIAELFSKVTSEFAHRTNTYHALCTGRMLHPSVGLPALSKIYAEDEVPGVQSPFQSSSY